MTTSLTQFLAVNVQQRRMWLEDLEEGAAMCAAQDPNVTVYRINNIEGPGVATLQKLRVKPGSVQTKTEVTGAQVEDD